MLKTKIAVITLIIALTSVANVFASNVKSPMKAEIKTNAHTFEHKLQLENHIYEMQGISEVELNTQTKIITIKYDSNQITSDMIIFSIVNNLGYSAELQTDKSIECKEARKNNKSDSKKA